MSINDHNFEAAYHGFVNYITQQEGKLFTTFNDCEFLRETELEYKQRAFYAGHVALKREHWDEWLETPGKILDAVRAACLENVSSNLLEHGHRYGPAARDYRALEDLKGRPVAEMEQELHQFLRPDATDPSSLAPRFDRFSQYLSAHGLGSRWRFLTYLVFLLDKEAYFPILADLFEDVMRFHGLDHKLSRQKITWSRYQTLLDFATELRHRLTERGHAPTSLLDVHTYIFLVGKQVLPRISEYQKENEPAWTDILNARQSKSVSVAKQREETGWQGERAVFEAEKARLREAGRPDLANQVQYVAEESVGYDIASFRTDGEPLHIEVKTTTRTADDRFWLTSSEKRVAEQETDRWTVYRVVLLPAGAFQIKDIGNVVHDSGWHIEPDSYVVQNKKDPDL